MPDLPRAGGSAQMALGQGLMALGEAFGNLAQQQNRAAQALVDAGIGKEYNDAIEIVQNNYNQFISSKRLDPNYETLVQDYQMQEDQWIAEAEKVITLPEAKEKFQNWLATYLRDYRTNVSNLATDRLAADAAGKVKLRVTQAVNTGDVDTLQSIYDDRTQYVALSEAEREAILETAIPLAKFNSVYNKLSTYNPELALELVKNPEDAKDLGIDMSVLTPAQNDAMTQRIQTERDYAVAQQEKYEAKVVGESDNKMLDAEIALLTGSGDPSTWLSPDMVGAQKWPGDEGARKAQYWINALKADLNFLKVETEAVNLDAVYAVAFDPKLTDQQKKDKIRTFPGISGEDRAKVMNVVDMAKQNPAYATAAAQVIDAYQRAMSLGTKKDVKTTAAESVRAQRQIEELWLKNPGNTTMLNQAVDRILQDVKTDDLTNVILQETGVAPTAFATGEWRGKYKTATAFEYLREQGKLPVGAATEDMIKKAHELELDAIKNAKMPEIKNFFAVTADGSYIYSSKKIDKDKAGNIVIKKDVPLYKVEYQVKPGARGTFEYVPTIYQLNPATYQFDIIVWEQK